MWTRTFWKQAIERALKTGAQTAVALLGVAGLGVLDVDWTQTASVVGLAVVASLLTSVASAGVGPAASPSTVSTTDT